MRLDALGGYFDAGLAVAGGPTRSPSPDPLHGELRLRARSRVRMRSPAKWALLIPFQAIEERVGAGRRELWPGRIVRRPQLHSRCRVQALHPVCHHQPA